MDGTSARAALGLDPGAGRHDLKLAFRALAKRTHPDAGGDRLEFERLTRAYHSALADCSAARPTHGFLTALEITQPVVHSGRIRRPRRAPTRSFAQELRRAMAA